MKNKLIRLIVYDLRKSMFGMFTPLGYIVVPKLQDPAYQKIPEKEWSDYRKHNKELGRQDFDSQLEEDYEMKKDEWLSREQKGEQGIIAKERYKLGAWLGQQKEFKEATKNKKQQAVLAQNLFPQFTSAEITDIVEIARMGMDYSTIEKMAARRHDGNEPAEEPDKRPTKPAKHKRGKKECQEKKKSKRKGKPKQRSSARSAPTGKKASSGAGSQSKTRKAVRTLKRKKKR